MALPHLAHPRDLGPAPHLHAVPPLPSPSRHVETLSQVVSEVQPQLRARMRLVPPAEEPAGKSTYQRTVTASRPAVATVRPAAEPAWDEEVVEAYMPAWSPPTHLPNRLSPQAVKRGMTSITEFRRRLLSHLRCPISPGQGLRDQLGDHATAGHVFWEVFGRFGSRRRLVDELVKIVRERYDDLTWQVKQQLDLALEDRRAA